MTSTETEAKPRVLSGITATGKLTIGNYVGALSIWADEQDRYENFFFIADLHALTIPENIRPDELRRRIKEIVALYLACGLDPERSVLFLQSRVPAHAILGWIFDCMAPVSWFERMTQYKSKSADANPSGGLLTYPALMAADILLYQPRYVPVGDDQRQHIEFTRDVAQRFNSMFAEVFSLPEALVRKSGARIMGLDDPTAKMSKSRAETHEGHAIGLLDPPERIRRSIMRSVTDSGSVVDSSSLSPGVDNLLVLHEALSGATREETLNRFEGQGYGVLKKDLVELVIARLGPIQKRFDETHSDQAYLDGLLEEGAERASRVANQTLDRAMEAVGLR
jgi:tryptophanyl-tRNA synthetase